MSAQTHMNDSLEVKVKAIKMKQAFKGTDQNSKKVQTTGKEVVPKVVFEIVALFRDEMTLKTLLEVLDIAPLTYHR